MARMEWQGGLALVFKGDPLVRVVGANRIICKDCCSCVTVADAASQPPPKTTGCKAPNRVSFLSSNAPMRRFHVNDQSDAMALKATIFKIEMQIADMDRHYYHDHALTVARHPSETDERMMVRLLAFALHAHEALAFGNGLSADDEPDLWQKDLTGSIELWIDVGLPDEKLIRKACGRARQVFLYTYGGRVADMWWAQNSGKLERLKNLTVLNLPMETSQALAKLAQRTMQLQFTIQEGQIWVADKAQSVEVALTVVKTPAHVSR